jgi:hypothetical protein
MNGSIMLPASTLKSLLGKRLRAVARILFEHDGRIKSDDGPLELHLDDGTVFLLDGASDGESLRVRTAPWADPFEPPVSAENRLYIKEHGKWSRVEQSSEPKFASLIGKSISSVKILKNEFGREAGVQLSLEGTDLWFIVTGDECYVYWAHPIGFTASAK